MRTSTESDRFVAGSEIDIEPSNKSVNKVITTDIEFERGGESKICLGACVEVEGKDGGGVSDDSLDIDGVDERLGKSGGFERRVVESVNVVPDYYELVSESFENFVEDGEELEKTYIRSSHPCIHHLQYQP